MLSYTKISFVIIFIRFREIFGVNSHCHALYIYRNRALRLWFPGAAPGFLLGRRGGGGAKCLATAAPALKYRASPEKVGERWWGGGGGGGGTPTHFFQTCQNFFRLRKSS